MRGSPPGLVRPNKVAKALVEGNIAVRYVIGRATRAGQKLDRPPAVGAEGEPIGRNEAP
jgi:hypothetical protein